MKPLGLGRFCRPLSIYAANYPPNNSLASKAMISGKLLTLYIGISAAIALLTSPGFGHLSASVILIGGSTGCLRLIVEVLPLVYYEDSWLGRSFSGQALATCCFALVLWALGGLLVFLGNRTRWRTGYIVWLIAVCVVGSAYNLFWLVSLSG